MNFENWLVRERKRKRVPPNSSDDLRHISDYFQAPKSSGGLESDASILVQFTFERALCKARRWSTNLARRAESEKPIPLGESEAEIIYNEAGWEVVVPKTAHACRQYAIGTRWCTLNTTTAEHYMKKGNLFVIRNKNRRDKNNNFTAYQIHLPSRQSMNKDDERINLQNVAPPSVRDAIFQYEKMKNPESALRYIVCGKFPRRRKGNDSPLASGQVTLVKELFLKVEKEVTLGRAVIEWACWCGHIDLVNLVMEKWADIPTFRALQIAIVQGRTEIVWLLIDDCSRDERFHEYIRVAAGYAKLRGHLEILEILKAYNIKIPENFNSLRNLSHYSVDASLTRIRFPAKLFSSSAFTSRRLACQLRTIEYNVRWDSHAGYRDEIYSEVWNLTYSVDLTEVLPDQEGFNSQERDMLAHVWFPIMRRLACQYYRIFRETLAKPDGFAPFTIDRIFLRTKASALSGLQKDILRRCSLPMRRAQKIAERILLQYTELLKIKGRRSPREPLGVKSERR